MIRDTLAVLRAPNVRRRLVLARCGCSVSDVSIRVHDAGACNYPGARHDHATCARCGREWITKVPSGRVLELVR